MLAAGTRRTLFSALAGLRDEDREVIGARYLRDLSEAETAEALGLRRGAIKSRTSRALGRLRVIRGNLDTGTTDGCAASLHASSDAELEAALRALAQVVAWPSAGDPASGADLAAAVRTRIQAVPARARTFPNATLPAWQGGPSWRPARRAVIAALIALLAVAAIAGPSDWVCPVCGLRASRYAGPRSKNADGA